MLFNTTLNYAIAQNATRAPVLDPQQIERQIRERRNETAGNTAAGLTAPALKPQDNQGDTTPLLKLSGIRMTGASALPPSLFETAYRDLIGTMVSQADLITITGRISQIYRDRGYSLSRAIIPPQDVKSGMIQIQVIEGQITEIVVKGDDKGIYGVRSMLAPLMREAPARLETIERRLLRVNDLPGVRIKDTALEEIGTTTGRFRLVVTVGTWRIHMAQGVDNSGTEAVGPWQAFSSTAFNSAFLRGDSLAVSLSTVANAPSQLLYGRVGYDMPLGDSGFRLGASALYSDVAPGDLRRTIDTHALTQSYELRGSYVAVQTRKTALTLSAALGYSDTTDRDRISPNYDDHIRTVSLMADYKLQDEFGGWNYASAVFRQGLSVLGASRRGDSLLSRNGASGDFSLVSLTYTRIQKITDIWSVRVTASGQYTPNPLLISQQFYLGAAGLGPGYYSGDNGFAGSAELRFDQTLNSKDIKGYQLYTFVDGGGVWNADNPAMSTLASVGIGARVFFAGQLQAGLGIATPLRVGTAANDPALDPHPVLTLECPEILPGTKGDALPLGQ